MSELIVVGLNHRSAPVEIREKIHVASPALEEAISSLRALPGVEGATILSTCNRVEAIVSADSGYVSGAVIDWFCKRAGVDRENLDKHLYVLRQDAAVEHLFRVASG